jgi:hypothetical protein
VGKAAALISNNVMSSEDPSPEDVLEDKIVSAKCPASLVAAYISLVMLISCNSGQVPVTNQSMRLVTGSALLSWRGVTTYSDGSTLAPSGYRIYYGTAPDSYTSVIEIPIGNLSSLSSPTFTITDLPAGTYYFTIAVYDSANVQSYLSSAVSKVIK